MHYQKDWKRHERVTDVAEVSNYYEKYQEYEGEYKGQFHNVTVIYAYSTYKRFADKNNADSMIESETINLICLRDEDQTYIPVTLWGARRQCIAGVWSEWGNNPVAIQDFLYIAGQQKGVEEIEKCYSYATSWEQREVYPHICGTKLKICVAKIGERAGKNNAFYPVLKYAIFNEDGRSALEMQMNDESMFNARETYKEFTKLYKEFVGEEVAEAEVVKDKPKPAPKKKVTKEVEPIATTGISADEEDLPF